MGRSSPISLTREKVMVAPGATGQLTVSQASPSASVIGIPAKLPLTLYGRALTAGVSSSKN